MAVLYDPGIQLKRIQFVSFSYLEEARYHHRSNDLALLIYLSDMLMALF